MCWAHAAKAMDRKLNSVPLDIRRILRGDINKLQLCTDVAQFERAGELMRENWNRLYGENEPVKSFMAFEGASPFVSQNNGLESLNKTTKELDMARKRVSFRTFVDVVENVVHRWSSLPDYHVSTLFKRTKKMLSYPPDAMAEPVEERRKPNAAGPGSDYGIHFKASPRCRGEQPKTPYFVTFFDVTGDYPEWQPIRQWEDIRLCAQIGDVDFVSCHIIDGSNNYTNLTLTIAIVHFCGEEPKKSKVKYVKFPTTIGGGKWIDMEVNGRKKNLSLIDMGVINLDQ